MRPEVRPIVSSHISRNGYIFRPFMALFATGAIMVGSHRDASAISVDADGTSVAGVQHFEVQSASNFIGPKETKSRINDVRLLELEADQELRIGITKALDEEVQEQEKALEPKKAAKVVKPISPVVSAQAVSGEFTVKNITGYYCEYDSGYYGDGGGFCGNMADGQTAHNGAAACGPSYPLGTVFQIEGYGEVTCEDRGSGVPDNHIDVFTYFSSGLSSIPVGQRNVVQVR